MCKSTAVHVKTTPKSAEVVCSTMLAAAQALGQNTALRHSSAKSMPFNAHDHFCRKMEHLKRSAHCKTMCQQLPLCCHVLQKQLHEIHAKGHQHLVQRPDLPLKVAKTPLLHMLMPVKEQRPNRGTTKSLECSTTEPLALTAQAGDLNDSIQEIGVMRKHFQ
jgi:hypothetical protein